MSRLGRSPSPRDPAHSKILDIAKVIAVYSVTQQEKTLNLKKNDIVYVLGARESGWLDVLALVKDQDGPAPRLKRGWFPGNYVRSVSDNKLREQYFDKLIKYNEVIETRPENPPLKLDLQSPESIARDFYNGKVQSNVQSPSSYPLPIIWKVNINETGNPETSLSFTNEDLGFHCHHLPVLIHPSFANSKSHSSSTTGKQPFLSKADLFYHQTNDITSLQQLFESILYSTAMLRDFIPVRDKLKTSKIIKATALTITYICITIRQLESYIPDYNMKREIRHLLKTVLKYSSLIKLNANIHYTHKNSNINQPSNNIPDDNIINNNNNNNSMNIGNDPVINPITNPFMDPARIISNSTLATRNDSVSTTTSTHTVTQPLVATTPTFPPISNNMRMTSVSSNFSKASTIDLNNNNMHNTLDPKETNENKFEFFNDLLMKHIDILQENIQLLFYLLHNCVVLNSDDNNTNLPQIFPRFFYDSFGNGSWSNVFIDQTSTNNNDNNNNNNFDNINNSKKSTTSLTSIISDGSTTTTSVGNILSPTSSASKFINEQTLQNNIENFISIPSPTSTNVNRSISSTPAIKRPQLNSTATSTAVNSVVAKVKTRLNNRIYPLNRDTLKIMKSRKETLYHDMVHYMTSSLENGSNIKEILKVYTQLNDNIINMYIIEHLDLSFFHNLRNFLDSGDPCDETIKLLRHTSTNILFLLNNVFEIKQAFHDVTTDLTIATQQVTLEDPKVFNSMIPYHKVGSMERFQIKSTTFSRDGFQEEKSSSEKCDKYAVSIYKQMIKVDTDVEDSAFINTYDQFKMSYTRYYDVNCAAYSVVEKLVEEKERIINYVARTMQDTVIELLQKDEFKDATWFESDFAKENIVPTADLKALDTNNDSLPWYLQSEIRDSISFDQSGKNVKSAPKEILVKYLLHSYCDGTMNIEFMDVFLLTFRSMFTSTTEFILVLTSCYNSEPPAGLTFNEYNEWMEKKLSPIRKNIIKVLREFFKKYWINTYWEVGLDSIIVRFLNSAKEDNIPGTKLLMTDVDLLFRNCKFAKKTITHSHELDTTLTAVHKISQSTKQNKALKLSNIAATQFAQQITLINHDIYCQISIFECLDKIWGKQKHCDFGGSPHISKFIEHANLLTNYVSYKVVSQPDIKKRVKLISFFITVALYCQRLNNFATLTAIISALYSSPIHRLQKTWAQVSNDSKEILQKLDNLMDSKKNFINYRECLRSVPKMTACVPFFGVYLSDLTFTNSGNQDISGVINFRKRVMIHDIIRDIESFQKRTYITTLAKNNDVQNFILGALHNIPDLDRQYQLSLEIEPRGASTSDDTNKSSRNTKFWRRKQGMKLFG